MDMSANSIVKYIFILLEMIIKYFELKLLLFWLESIIFSVMGLSYTRLNESDGDWHEFEKEGSSGKKVEDSDYCLCLCIHTVMPETMLASQTSSIFKYIKCFILNRIFVSEKPFLHGQWQFDNLFCKCDITIAGMRSFLNSVFSIMYRIWF